MATKKEVVVGIDLGTTNSCVAAYVNGRVEIIANDQGHRTTPSWVSFSNTATVVGEAAKYQGRKNPKNTIFGVKRFIGKWYDDETVQADLPYFNYDIFSDKNKPKIRCQVKGQAKEFLPEEISAIVLTKMKEIAEDYLEQEVNKVVVTLPAHFDDNQKEATREACRLAGLELLATINEPTAAAVAYAIDRDVKSRGTIRTILVYDVGGGTLDVSILKVTREKVEVMATGGNSHLAGEDFENNLFKHLVVEFKKEFGDDLTTNEKAVARLKQACLEAKEYLSFNPETTIDLDGLHRGNDFDRTITRELFEKINEADFEKTMTYVRDAITSAKITDDEGTRELKITDIDDIVLVGGSTRIPKLRELLKNFFNGKDLKEGINPDEAVAHGAAIWAAHLNKSLTGVNLNLAEVIPLSIGLQTSGGLMDVIIKRNTRIPAKASKIYTTLVGDQEIISIEIFQGERPVTAENTLIGSVTIKDIPPGPPGVPSIEISYDINDEGMLKVSACINKDNERITEHKIVREKLVSKSKKTIEKMINDSEANKERDEEEKKRIVARNNCRRYGEQLKYFFESKDVEGSISKGRKDSALKSIADHISWLGKNSHASREQFELRKKTLEREVESDMQTVEQLFKNMFKKK